MAEIPCIHCGKVAPEIEGVAYGGKLGEEIKKKICDPCWKEWMAQSTKIINEYRLNLREERAREFLKKQMRMFLNMPEPGSAGEPPAGGGVVPTGTPPPPSH